ncbi:MAG: TfoX/Sxy family DNA transformation protein [Planctomycetaceae bacterium]
MPDPNGDKLFVNLGASQARRRLKGFGHGVRKVASAGRNQAVIIHTATGRHLQELKKKFADVKSSASAGDLSEPIENLQNLGPASGFWLREVGIQSTGDLERVGPVVAYTLVKQRHPAATLTWLWAMAAGLKGINLQKLSEPEKGRLRRQLAELDSTR